VLKCESCNGTCKKCAEEKDGKRLTVAQFRDLRGHIRYIVTLYADLLETVAIFRDLRDVLKDDAFIVSMCHRLEEGLHYLARALLNLVEYLRGKVQIDFYSRCKDGEFKDPYEKAGAETTIKDEPLKVIKDKQDIKDDYVT
jgi:hypothetical protein